MTDQDPTPKPKKEARNYAMHGYYRARKLLKPPGRKGIDRRCTISKAMEKWKESYIKSLNLGKDIAQRDLDLLDQAATLQQLIQEVDKWIQGEIAAGHMAVINKRSKSLHPVVAQRQSCIDAQMRILSQIGNKKEPDLAAMCAGAK